MYPHIHIHTHIYVCGYKKRYIKEPGTELPTPLRGADPALALGEAAGEGKPLVRWCGRSLLPSHAGGGCLGRCSCCWGSQRGCRWWEQRDGIGTGTAMGMGDAMRCALPAGSPVGTPCCNPTFPGKEGPGERRRGLVPQLNFIHPSTVSQVAFRIRKSKKYIHRCSLVYLLTLCNLFALICFCLSWDFPF